MQPLRKPKKTSGTTPSTKKRKLKARRPRARKKRVNQAYGTSKLERDFANDFLVANGIRFIYQYAATEIGRFYDFAIVPNNGVPYIMESKDGVECVSQSNENLEVELLIEIDGGYYHSDPRVVDEDKLNHMQRHNKFVDKLKDRWAGLHCIPLLRIWEYDIRHNPKLVLDELSKYIGIGEHKLRVKNKLRKPIGS